MEENVSMISQMNDGIKEFNKNLEKTDLLMGGVGDTLKTITSWVGAGTISLGLKDMVSSLMKINEEATKSAVILGKKAFGKDLKENIRDISRNITNLQKEIGISTEKAKKFTNLFLEARITENLHDATAAAAMFERATGAVSENITDMYNEMYHGAKMSTESINSVMASMAKVQHTAGLTEKGMNAVTKEAGRMAVQLRGFGATDKQIQSMTVSLGKYVSSMEKVGVSAQEATAWVHELTNPDNIEKNIGLYAQMGISMTDALNGNFSAMQQGEQEFAQRIVDMGPIAGAAYARQFGYSYSKAMKTMNLEDAGVIDVDPQEQAMESLKKASEEVLGITGKISKWFEQIKGSILQFGPAILAEIAVVIAMFRSKILGKAKKAISDTVGDGIKEGIEGANIASGLAGLFKKNFDKINNGGSGYDKTADVVKNYNTIANNGGGIGQSITEAFKAYGAQVKNAYAENKQAELTQLAEINITKNKLYNEETKNIEHLIETLKKANVDSSNLQQIVADRNNGENGGPTSITDLFLSGDKKNKKFKTSAMQELARQEITGTQTELASKKNNLNEQITSIGANIHNAWSGNVSKEGYEDAVKRLSEQTGASYAAVEKALTNSNGTYKSFAKQLAQQEGGTDKLVKSLDELKTTNEGLKKADEDLKKVNDQAVKDPKAGILTRIFEPMTKPITDTVSKIKDGYGDWKERNGAKDISGIKGFGRALGVSTGRTAVKGIIGLGKLTKSIAGLGLKMGVMGIVMNLFKGLLQNVMSKLQPSLDKIMDTFSKVFDDPQISGAIEDIASILIDLISDLGPTFGNLLKTLVGDILIPLVRFLLPPLLKVLSVIVKVLSLIPTLLSKIPGIGPKYFEPVATALNNTSEALWTASDNMKEGNKTRKENTDAIKKSGEDKAAEMRLSSMFGTSQLVESGAAIGRDPSTVETAVAMQETKAAIQESKANDQEYKEQQKQYNEMLASGNFELQKAVNLILEKLSGTISPIDVNIASSAVKL